MDENQNDPREDLKKEENRLLEKSILKANKEAIKRLREQRIQLLKDCMLSSDSDGDNKEFNIEKMDQEWREESQRTTLVLDTIYDNLRMRDATDTYKNTAIIKNRNGEQLYRVTTIVMTEKLSKQANDSVKIQGTISIQNNKSDINYKYGEEEEDTTESIENKATIDGKIINEITVEDPHNNKENISLEQLAKKIKAKPKIKEVKIIKEARKLRSTKRPKSPEKEKDSNKKKPSHHNVKSRQDGLAGEVKPTKSRTPTPQEARTPEPTPGTSGMNKDTEKYRSTSKTMILSPDGKLIPFRMMEKDTEDKKEDGNASDPPRYKYTL